MSVFAIGDLHLSFSTNKPMDVFSGWENYVSRLEKNWKKLISDDDTVIIAGDVSWGMNYKEIVDDFKFIDSLPGKKVIIKGNHDLWWDTMSKNEKFKKDNDFKTINFLFNSAYETEGIAVCGTRSWFFDAESDKDKKVLNREIGRLKKSIELAKETGLEPIVFLHYPPLTLTQECEEITSVLREEGIKSCYYAHMHGYTTNSSFNSTKYGIKFHLISADYLNFCPYLIKK